MTHVAHVGIAGVLIVAFILATWISVWFIIDTFTKPDIKRDYKHLPWWKRWFEAFCMFLALFTISAISGGVVLLVFVGLLGLFGYGV